jgi:hypothetical protein
MQTTDFKATLYYRIIPKPELWIVKLQIKDEKIP